MLRLRRLLAILILIAVAILVALVWRHLQQQSPQDILEALPEQIDLALDQLHYTHNEDGQRSWTLDAEKAQYLGEQGVATLDEVALVVYRSGRFGEMRLTAAEGRFLQDRQLVEVWGDVEIETERGDRLYTKRLAYDGNLRLILTAEPVRLINPRMELTGVGMRVELDSGRLQLERNVRMLLLSQERTPSGNE